MASPIVIKAKVSGSAKAKPVHGPGSTVGGASSPAPRVVIRSPVSTSSTPSTPVSATPIRVTAKVTRSATTKAMSPALPSPSTPFGGHVARQRTASTSTSMSGQQLRAHMASPPLQPPAATHGLNRARTGSMYSLNSTTRAHSPVRRPPSPLKPRAKVTPAPTERHHSPPTSVVSAQSASTSSLSSPASPRLAVPPSPRAQFHQRANWTAAPQPIKLKAKITPVHAPLPSSPSSTPSSSRTHSRTASDASELDVAAEARINRKIADLEITNASLAQLNSKLEADKDKQHKEVVALRRKLRETRLNLPPPLFKRIKEREAARAEEGLAVEVEGDDEDDEDEQEDEQDPVFDRVSAQLALLIQQAREAVADKGEKVRVLGAAEVRAWEGRRSSVDGELDDDPDPDASFRTEATEATEVDDEDAREEREVTMLLDEPPDRTSSPRPSPS